jgi:capsular polysaccharide export protein
VGLGADLISPVSWVVDTRGIYFDATRPSDLEVMLQTNPFSSELLMRASRFRERIVSTGLTKYNVGMGVWKRPGPGRRVILVPGQVESDASLRFGAPGIRSNLGLLKAVREAHRNAYVLYKPHPDVVAGLKAKGKSEVNMEAWCDEVLTDVSMGELLPVVDEVHVLTSLAGFEALLRNKKVTCYGQPFYAGWGLTQDFYPIHRRTRILTLNQLIAGVLLLYPRYVSRITGEFISPEQAVDDLDAWRETPLPGGPRWYVRLRRLLLRSMS